MCTGSQWRRFIIQSVISIYLGADDIKLYKSELHEFHISINDSYHRSLKMKTHHNKLHNYAFTVSEQLSPIEKPGLLFPPTLPALMLWCSVWHEMCLICFSMCLTYVVLLVATVCFATGIDINSETGPVIPQRSLYWRIAICFNFMSNKQASTVSIL